MHDEIITAWLDRHDVNEIATELNVTLDEVIFALDVHTQMYGTATNKD